MDYTVHPLWNGRMKVNNFIYDYSSNVGYRYTSLHRQVVKFDPLNTDNPLILDYINSFKMDRENSTLLYDIINSEINLKNDTFANLPISYFMLFNRIVIDWIDIIHQMLFIDDASSTFFGEYGEIIENIILCDTPDVKDSTVYRSFGNGMSVFHIAGKIWLINKYKDFIANSINNVVLDKELKYIFNCYSRLEDCLGSDRKYCILYMSDFSGVTLKEYLEEFAVHLVKMGKKWQDARNLK